MQFNPEHTCFYLLYLLFYVSLLHINIMKQARAQQDWSLIDRATALMERYVNRGQGIYPENDAGQAGPSNFGRSSQGTYSAQIMEQNYYTPHMSMPDPTQLSSASWSNQFFAPGPSSMADHIFSTDSIHYSYGSVQSEDPTNVVEDIPIDPPRRSRRQRHHPRVVPVHISTLGCRTDSIEIKFLY